MYDKIRTLITLSKLVQISLELLVYNVLFISTRFIEISTLVSRPRPLVLVDGVSRSAVGKCAIYLYLIPSLLVKFKMALEAVNRVVLPGDIVGNIADLDQTVNGKGKLKLGPGLRQEKGNVIAFKSGVLRHRIPGVYWIDCSQRRVRNTIFYFRFALEEERKFLKGRYVKEKGMIWVLLS